MNKRIRSLIDEIFSEMKMTAENLALRDELMANAQARYEDAVQGGKSEEEAFAEVASSLGDVRSLLREMNGMESEKKTAGGTVTPHAEGDTVTFAALDDEDDDGEDEAEDDDGKEDEDRADGPKVQVNADLSDFDLGDTLNKAFSALGDFGRQIMPQAKKFVQQVDDATGGAIDELSRAAHKGMRDAQKAASDAIDKFSAKKVDLTVDFGEGASDERTPQELREEAADLRAQAEIKQVVGDQEGAREMRAQAYALETQADALEQAQAMRRASDDAAQEATAGEPEQTVPEQAESYLGEDGEIDESAFARAVDDMVRDANEAVQGAGGARGGSDGERRFPAAGLRTVDVKVDADDVRVEPTDDADVSVCWWNIAADRQPVVTMDGHTLSVRRANPDVFKTFFSVFTKDGGKIVIRVPRGYAADYAINTTSGDVKLSGVDVDDVSVSTTSGDVRVEPDPGIRAKEVSVGSVSGDVTVSACAGDVKVNTVSGDQFVSCDASRVDADGVSGDIHIEGACDEWEVATVSGDATLICTVAPTRKIQLNTVSGDVRLTLPGDIRGFVADLSGMSGSIENEFGPNRYGTCALPIHMDTISGDLIITRL